jgi:hypothetical protein
MIQQIELQNAAGFIDPPGEAQISLRRGGVTRRDHDERVGGVSVTGLKISLGWARDSLTVPWLTVAILIKCCLASKITTRSDSRSRNRISEQRSAIVRGLSTVSDWRSSRKATAPMRRELTSRGALGRETKGKSSSTEARAKTVEIRNALRARPPVFENAAPGRAGHGSGLSPSALTPRERAQLA